ncbi:hypothetical protein [Cylindrospermopsis raciborskii]|uniref:hypothetical protein n=1 Tax=Cylindrospermopsis raciborskii TaxID=77022 RepID=UPI00387A5FB4
MTIAGKDGDDAKIYLEKQLKQRLARLEELQGTVAKCRNGAISCWFVGFRIKLNLRLPTTKPVGFNRLSQF